MLYQLAFSSIVNIGLECIS